MITLALSKSSDACSKHIRYQNQKNYNFRHNPTQKASTQFVIDNEDSYKFVLVKIDFIHINRNCIQK